MKIIHGSPVSGDNFFRRDRLVEKAWELIESGSNILIAAPRRVGKTSLMFQLRDNPKEHYSFIYMNTESVNNENEFFRRVVNKVLKTEFASRSQKVFLFIQKHKPTIKKVGLESIEFGNSDKHNYYEMLSNVLKSPGSTNHKLIIMLDEFPETFDNIVKDEGEPDGKHFLHSNRELRQDPDISKNVQFIYTGSIGLENLVSKYNVIKAINDLTRLEVPPLLPQQGESLIRELLKNIDFDLTALQITYILNKIEWLIPFYIQLSVYEINTIVRDEHLGSINEGVIDRAMNGILEQRQHFDHWHTRLRGSMERTEYKFAKELLNKISDNTTINKNEIYNLAVKYELEDKYKDLLSSLIYDGYINNNNEKDTYRFNSPILRMWWRENVAN